MANIAFLLSKMTLNHPEQKLTVLQVAEAIFQHPSHDARDKSK